MRIALTGAHSTGKTTLLERLKEERIFKTYTFITEITRSVMNKGHSINEEGGDTTQLLIMESHSSNLTYENSIMDRCFLDGIVYTDYLHQKGKVSLGVFEESLKLFQHNVKKYDKLFYIIPEVDLKEDGVRSSNLLFRQQIVELFEFYISFYRLPVIYVSGSLEERTNQIISNLGEVDEI